MSISTFAQQFDQHYLKWKAQQEAQDRRLTDPQSSSSAQHYLARPTQHGSSSTQQIRLNSASLEQLQQLSGGFKKAEAILLIENKMENSKVLKNFSKSK